MATPDNDKLLPILTLEELVEIFEYTNMRAARRAIRLGTFPVPLFELAGRTVAHADAVNLLMDTKRKEAMQFLEEHHGITE